MLPYIIENNYFTASLIYIPIDVCLQLLDLERELQLRDQSWTILDDKLQRVVGIEDVDAFQREFQTLSALQSKLSIKPEDQLQTQPQQPDQHKQLQSHALPLPLPLQLQHPLKIESNKDDLDHSTSSLIVDSPAAPSNWPSFLPHQHHNNRHLDLASPHTQHGVTSTTTHSSSSTTSFLPASLSPNNNSNNSNNTNALNIIYNNHHNQNHDPSSPNSTSSSTHAASSSSNNALVAVSSTPSSTVSASTTTLDTSEISLRVRDILSANNIGQRIFAKHVLGLSQGTVSELLSKPKHWDKLTEKGRESYRKMYVWVQNKENIEFLKTLNPKRGREPASARSDDPQTEERITQILSEAQWAMQQVDDLPPGSGGGSGTENGGFDAVASSYGGVSGLDLRANSMTNSVSREGRDGGREGGGGSDIDGGESDRSASPCQDPIDMSMTAFRGRREIRETREAASPSPSASPSRLVIDAEISHQQHQPAQQQPSQQHLHAQQQQHHSHGRLNGSVDGESSPPTPRPNSTASASGWKREEDATPPKVQRRGEEIVAPGEKEVPRIRTEESVQEFVARIYREQLEEIQKQNGILTGYGGSSAEVAAAAEAYAQQHQQHYRSRRNSHAYATSPEEAQFLDLVAAARAQQQQQQQLSPRSSLSESSSSKAGSGNNRKLSTPLGVGHFNEGLLQQQQQQPYHQHHKVCKTEIKEEGSSSSRADSPRCSSTAGGMGSAAAAAASAAALQTLGLAGHHFSAASMNAAALQQLSALASLPNHLHPSLRDASAAADAAAVALFSPKSAHAAIANHLNASLASLMPGGANPAASSASGLTNSAAAAAIDVNASIAAAAAGVSPLAQVCTMERINWQMMIYPNN